MPRPEPSERVRQRWTYNALDCIATLQVADALIPRLTPLTRAVYEAEMGLQAPCFHVSLRGVRLDREAVKAMREELREEIASLIRRAEERSGASLAGPKAFSPDRLRRWLYEELGLREQRTRDGNITTNVRVLERLARRAIPVDAPVPNPEKGARKDVAAEVATLVLEARNLSKLLQVLETPHALGPEREWRMRGTFNVGGTESFRLSSSAAPIGVGTNLQNQTKRLRHLYIPDEGFRMAQGDQERAESRVIAYLSADPAYIEAHLHGNTHLQVAKLVWPELDWPSDPEEALRVAKEPDFVRHHSRYDLAKRVQHGSNLGGSPRGIAIEIGIPVKVAEEAQQRYFEAFPGIRAWQQRIREELAESGTLTIAEGWTRQFFGNPRSPETWREALAFGPQSVVAWTTHIVWHRLWKTLDGPDFQLLVHTHDGVLCQYRGEWEAWSHAVEEACRVEWELPGGRMAIPWEWNIGANWKEVS